MTDLIGTLHTTRYACTGGLHVLGCHNPLDGLTYCQCGAVRLPGRHTTTHERPLYTHPGNRGEVEGWDRYVLAACDCHPSGTARTDDATPVVVDILDHALAEERERLTGGAA